MKLEVQEEECEQWKEEMSLVFFFMYLLAFYF